MILFSHTEVQRDGQTSDKIHSDKVSSTGIHCRRGFKRKVEMILSLQTDGQIDVQSGTKNTQIRL